MKLLLIIPLILSANVYCAPVGEPGHRSIFHLGLTQSKGITGSPFFMNPAGDRFIQTGGTLVGSPRSSRSSSIESADSSESVSSGEQTLVGSPRASSPSGPSLSPKKERRGRSSTRSISPHRSPASSPKNVNLNDFLAQLKDNQNLVRPRPSEGRMIVGNQVTQRYTGVFDFLSKEADIVELNAIGEPAFFNKLLRDFKVEKLKTMDETDRKNIALMAILANNKKLFNAASSDLHGFGTSFFRYDMNDLRALGPDRFKLIIESGKFSFDPQTIKVAAENAVAENQREILQSILDHQKQADHAERVIQDHNYVKNLKELYLNGRGSYEGLVPVENAISEFIDSRKGTFSADEKAMLYDINSMAAYYGRENIQKVLNPYLKEFKIAKIDALKKEFKEIPIVDMLQKPLSYYSMKEISILLEDAKAINNKILIEKLRDELNRRKNHYISDEYLSWLDRKLVMENWNRR